MEDAVQTVLPVSLIGNHLTSEESNFVYNLEILGMPARLAAVQAGVKVGLALAPHIIQARENVRRAVRDTTQITKEDVVAGLKDAIYDAKLYADPMAQIKGWSELANLLGFNKPEAIEININTTIDVVRKQVKNLSDEALIKQLGADTVIDGEFYVRKEE